jgi:hypothetical protein
MGNVDDWLTYPPQDERRASSQGSAANPDIAAGSEPPARTHPVGVPTAMPKPAAAAADAAADSGTPTDTHSARAYVATPIDVCGTTAAAAMASAPVASAAVTSAAVTSAAARLEHCRWQEKAGGNGAHQKRGAKHDDLHSEPVASKRMKDGIVPAVDRPPRVLLGFAAVSFIAAFKSFDLRLGAILGSGVFLLGAAGFHVYQMITAHNFAPGNAGIIFWSDILLPLIGFVLWLDRWRHRLRERERT